MTMTELKIINDAIVSLNENTNCDYQIYKGLSKV